MAWKRISAALLIIAAIASPAMAGDMLPAVPKAPEVMVTEPLVIPKAPEVQREAPPANVVVAPNGRKLVIVSDVSIGAARGTAAYLIVSDSLCWPLDAEQRKFVAELIVAGGPDRADHRDIVMRRFIGSAWVTAGKLGKTYCEWMMGQAYVKAAYRIW